MTFIKKNIWTILSLVLVMVLSMTGSASANTGDSVETIALDKAANVFEAARNIMFVVGGFGLVAVAFAAISGKINWKWVGSLAVGLGIIAAAGAVINYATNDGLENTGESWTDNYNG